MNLLARLRESFGAALPEGVDRAAFEKAVRPSTDPKFGDYQANGCMALAKALGASRAIWPRSWRRAVDLAPFAGPPEVAGPGFLNLRLQDAWVASALGELLVDAVAGPGAAREGEDGRHRLLLAQCRQADACGALALDGDRRQPGPDQLRRWDIAWFATTTWATGARSSA